MARFDFLEKKMKGLFVKKKDKSPSNEPVYFISAPMAWSAHVESYLDELAIPYLKRGRKGAALAIELGPGTEIYDYYIPEQAALLASRGIDELREQIGFNQQG